MGEPGEDEGHDPPFGNNRAGAIVGRNATGLTTCMMIDANPKDSLNVTWKKPYPAVSGKLAMATLTADKLTRLWVDAGQAGLRPHKLIGGTGALYGDKYSTVLLDFTVQGQLVNVIPTKSRSTRQNGECYEVMDQTNETITVRGDFASIYDVGAGQDVAPGGAQTITLDAVTGQVLNVRRGNGSGVSGRVKTALAGTSLGPGHSLSRFQGSVSSQIAKKFDNVTFRHCEEQRDEAISPLRGTLRGIASLRSQ